MRASRRPLRQLHLMVLAITATFCASALVLYFQYGALAALRHQRRVILKQVSQQTATEVARELRRILNGPAQDMINAVDPPQLRNTRLDWLGKRFSVALDKYPHVDRFVLWNERTHAISPDQVLFYGRERPPSASAVDTGPETDGFFSDPVLGSAILALIEKHAPSKKLNLASELTGPGTPYNVYVRMAYTDARRVEYFSVLGYVVKPAMLREPLIANMLRGGIDDLLAQRGGDVPLKLRVTDEQGVVYGPRDADPQAATVEFPMLFFPYSSPWQYAIPAAPHPWRIEVSAPLVESGWQAVLFDYWPTVASVFLMLVALALTLQANHRASELTRMQGDFISNASHQLKTPLSLLSAATETVAMDRVRSPEKLSQYLGIIRGEVARLSVLVQGILEFSRLQQQRRFEFETVDLGALVRETVVAFEGSLSARHFAFVVEEAHPLLQVQADPAALEQVIVNLLDNAVKYSTDTRQVTVRVASRGLEATVEVVDRGVGVEHGDLDHIFDKFYRGKHSSSSREGFGLGLSIVQELVAAHKGRVEVESEPGFGSTFRVVIPAKGMRPDAVAGFPGPAGAKEVLS